MKINELNEAGVGKIVKGVNTTPDVQPGETERQAKKLFPMNKNGKPKSLGVPGASPNVAFNLGLTEDELTTIQRAEMFAQQAHKDHKRKYTGDPYYVHLDEVRRIVAGVGGSEDMQAAALLHDTVEDTSVTPADIIKEFGAKIAKLVVELTDVSKPEDGNRKVRKAIDRDKLSGASAEAQTIKYADLISNGKDIMKNDPKFAKVYMQEKADLLKVMTRGDSRLRSAALAMLPDELKENMSITGTERRRLERKKGIEVGTPEWFKHWFDLPYLREAYDDVGQKIYKGNTTRVVNTPVADKNISVADKRIAKFSQQRDMDDMTYKGAKWTAPGTNQTIAKAKSNINRAYSKQDKIDQRQGAGQSYITKGKPIKFPSSDTYSFKLTDDVTQGELNALERVIDGVFGRIGIDVEFTRHFLDRVNDDRNGKPITIQELGSLFAKEYKRWGKPIAQMGPDAQAVMKDLESDINIPFVLNWNGEELELKAKTVMRKKNFKTSNKEFPVESITKKIFEIAGRRIRLSKEQLEELIKSTAKELDVSYATARAIAYQESGIRQNIVGDKKLKNKAYGMYQVRSPALQDVNRLYKTNYTMADVAKDPAVNAKVGLLYFKAQKDFYGAKDDKQALAGYNGGPKAIKGGNKGANNYAKSVISTANDFDENPEPPRYYQKPGVDNPQTFGDIASPDDNIRPNTDYRTQPYPPKPSTQNKAPEIAPQPKAPTVQVSAPQTQQRTKVSYNDLARASNISDPNKIFVGGTVNLPNGSTYTIKKGDTLSGIAKNYNKGALGENVPTTNKPGSIGQHINWAGKNAPEKPKSNISVARRSNKQEPLNWWQKTLQKGRDLFDDEQLELKKKFEITDELKQLDSIFKKGKYEIRIVGGAVRDLALGKSPKDIDLATDATPQEMQKMFDSAGVKHIPTGIEHGTITAVMNGEPYEITTLRADVETDGRRAEVEFVRSWEEDAKRRDLTYNAMSMDFDGNLYDYHGGMDDLQDKVTRFVGDPEERIKEDYLRTLRYFRFQGRLDTPTFDRTTMNAIANNTDGLKQLSVERIWMEMGKILGGGNIQQILNAMNKAGVLNAIGLNYTPNNELMDGGDPIINLARITDDESIGPRWKMSNEEKGKLGFLLAEKGKTHSKDWYTDMMVDGFDRTQLDALARYNNQDDMIAYIKSFKAPEFPVDGNDLIKMGHERGPGIGKTLMALRNQWKAGNFSASKDELLKTMNEAVIPMLYHATYKPFLDSIMKNGLGGSGAQTQWEDSKPGYVYLAKDPEVAISHAEANDEVPDEYIDNIVVLSIDVSQLDSDNLEDDPNIIDDDSTLAYKGIIPTNAFTVAIDEEGPFGVLARKASHVINKSQYEKAAMFMHKILQRKYAETGGKLRHTLGYYAQMIANQTGNKINWRELKAEYLDQFGNAMFEKINKNTPMGDVIDDFQQSDAPQFKGKSQEKRRQMAIAAKLSMMDSVEENFADGKKPGRKGLSKRVGIPKNATIAQLEKIAKNSTGERRRMAQWQLNMRRGKNKNK